MKKITHSIATFFKAILTLKDPEISLEGIILQEWPLAEIINPEIVWLDTQFNDFKENARTYPEHYFVDVFLVPEIRIEDACKVYSDYLDQRGDTKAETEDELLLTEINGTNKKYVHPTRFHLTKDKNGIIKLHQIVHRKIDGLLIITSHDWNA